MTIIDDEVLRRGLRAVGDSFEVSSDHPARILRAAREATTDAAQSRRVASPRKRRALVAAALVAVVSAIAGPLLRSETSPTRTALVTGAPAHQKVVVFGTGFAQGPAFSPYVSPTSLATRTQGALVTASPAGATGSSSRIESTGQVSVTVAKGAVESAVARLARLATRDGGSVVNSQVQRSTRSSGAFTYATVVLEVPQPRFATLVGQVQGVGHMTSVATASVDVTGQYVDLSARLTALEASRRQYLAIMSHASTVSDILAVQSQLNSIQGRIEQLQGQRNLLAHQSAFGTLSVSLSERGHHVAPRSANGLTRAFHGAVRGFVNGVEWLVRASGPALFGALCLAALALLARWAWRALRRRAL
ncbi:MAG: DUF4349 domain-containing protein [Acidobacteriota bacterium]|nr:DUF4349 domain-containing protein [Acidobacteriota bacterium]